MHFCFALCVFAFWHFFIRAPGFFASRSRARKRGKSASTQLINTCTQTRALHGHEHGHPTDMGMGLDKDIQYTWPWEIYSPRPYPGPCPRPCLWPCACFSMDNFKDMNMDMDSPCNILVGVHVLVQADMSILAWLFQRTTIRILTIAWTWHGRWYWRWHGHGHGYEQWYFERALYLFIMYFGYLL